MAVTAENRLHLDAIRSMVRMGLESEETYRRAVAICEEEGGP